MLGFQHSDFGIGTDRARGAADVETGRNRLSARVDDLDRKIPCRFVLPGESKKAIRFLRGFVVNQSPIQIASNSLVINLDLDVVPTIGLDRTRHVEPEAVLIEFDRVLAVSPASNIPPISRVAFARKTNQKALRAADFARFQGERVIAPTFLPEKAQAHYWFALTVSPVHNRPGSSIGFPARFVF